MARVRRGLSLLVLLLVAVSCVSDGGGTDDNAYILTLVSAVSQNNTTVLLTFNQPLKHGAEDLENYRISPQLKILNVALDPKDARQVKLTTVGQSERKYTVIVSNLRDIYEDPLGVDKNSAIFFGLPPDGNGVDTDGDGLSDADEQKGWDITITDRNGNKSTRHVTSDPTKADTDGDGVPDNIEKSMRTDPRAKDTDDDGLSDHDEIVVYASNPTKQDTDDDGLIDGDEVHVHHTSPTLNDSDGDGVQDGEEIQQNTNPLLADLPQFSIEFLGNADLQLQVDFEDGTQFSTAAGTSLQNAAGGTPLHTASAADIQTSTQSAALTAAIDAGDAPQNVRSKLSQPFGELDGYDRQTGTNFTSASRQNAQQQSATLQSKETHRNIASQSASLGIDIRVTNVGQRTFTLHNLTLAVMRPDAKDHAQYTRVATLHFQQALGAGGATLQSAQTTPPLSSTDTSIPPDRIRELLRSPTNLTFKVEGFELTDEHDVDASYLSDVTADRTALIVIDNGDGNVQNYRVATDVHRTDTGLPAGITMKQALHNILDFDYATKINASSNIQELTELDGQAADADQRQWWFVLSDLFGEQSSHTANPTDSSTNFDDIVLHNGDSIILAYAADEDADGLYDREERVYGTSDQNSDSDGDGLSDYKEVKQGWTVKLVGDPQGYQAYSDPTEADQDGDGWDDAKEEQEGTDPTRADTDGDGIADSTDAFPLDPSKPTTPPTVDHLNVDSVGLQLHLSATLNAHKGKTIQSATIDWGDSLNHPVPIPDPPQESMDLQNLAHFYSSPGVYLMKIRVEDSVGLVTTVKQSIEIDLAPLAEWLFDDMDNSSSSTADTSGNDYELSRSGCTQQPGVGHDGKGNSAMLIDNLNGCDTSSGYPRISAPKMGFGDDFSIALWLKLRNAKNNNNTGWVIGTDKASLRIQSGDMRFYRNGSSILSTDAINDTNWHFYVVVVSWNAQFQYSTVQLYKDGYLQKAITISAHMTDIDQNNRISIGNDGTSSENKLLFGTYDDIRIFDRVLTSEEVQYLYAH